MTETMTPIHAASDNSYFSPRSSPIPAKRLRSCFSPTRTPTGGNTPSRIHGSRSTSFSSECSSTMVDGRRSSKSVRWQENEECGAVTAFHPTWSAAEYDRTPLEPPSEAERTCVLPPRGSREFTSSYDCFGEISHTSGDLSEAEDEDVPSSPGEEISHESFILATPENAEDEDDEAVVETRQWEECMERRRMMFALRTRMQDQEHQPEFEGYRSLSAKLAIMLESIEARREPSPDEEEEDQEEDGTEDAEASQSEDEGDLRPCSSFTFTNLQSLHIRSTPLDAIPDEDESSTETDPDAENEETTTPSLISSAESDGDSSLISPQPSMMNFAPRIDGLPVKSLSLERTATVDVSPAVRC